MEKNFIEKVTNLEREKIKYVPKKLFERSMARLESMLSADDDQEELEWVHELQMKAESEEKEIYSIETDDKKPDISICPYCGGKMFLSFSDNDRRVSRYPYKGYNYSSIRGGDSIHYKCGYCGASSPNVFLRVSLLDENEVKKDIQKEIEGAISEIKREEEGEYDD